MRDFRSAERYRKSAKGKAAKKRYREKNSEKIKEYQRKWRAANPDYDKERYIENAPRIKKQRIARMKKYLQQMQADPYDPRHGRMVGYTYGCRCDRCREARRRKYESDKVA